MEDKKVDQIKFSLLDINGKDFDCELTYLVRREATAEDIYGCSALLYGLHSLIKNYPDFVYDLGQVAFRAAHPHLFEDDEDDDADFEFVFEPAEELKDALTDKKIVPFNKNKLN